MCSESTHTRSFSKHPCMQCVTFNKSHGVARGCLKISFLFECLSFLSMFLLSMLSIYIHIPPSPFPRSYEPSTRFHIAGISPSESSSHLYISTSHNYKHALGLHPYISIYVPSLFCTFSLRNTLIRTRLGCPGSGFRDITCQTFGPDKY